MNKEVVFNAVQLLETWRDDLLHSHCLCPGGKPDRSTLEPDVQPLVGRLDASIENLHDMLRMTYAEALELAPGIAEGCAAIAQTADEGGLSFMDEPVVSMIHVTDFGEIAEVIRVLLRGPTKA